MALAGKLSSPVEVPHEPGNFFIFRSLTAGQLSEAATVATMAAIRIAAELPQRQAIEPEAAARARAARDPFDDYDQETLCRYGIAGCRGAEYPDLETVLPENPVALDSRTTAWAARRIYEFNVRTVGEEPASVRP